TKKLLSLVSIDEKPNSISELSVYPNPAVNTLTIQFNEIENQNAEIRLFDQRGRLVIQEVVSLVDGKKTIDINQLENGLYIVETTMNGTKNRQKIIVQH
ncbi:MAG: T9SS type A sorting domain-containing protein, partial [Ignavibacteria bacterium]|nr:T9SS type A sorting domain-containing protein [Ignavibacteria bacterium]